VNDDTVPDECQCGDANGSGAYEADDLFQMFNCQISDPEALSEPCATTILKGDTQNSGQFEAADLFNIFQFQVDPTGSYVLTCSVRPSGTDPTAPAP